MSEYENLCMELEKIREVNRELERNLELSDRMKKSNMNLTATSRLDTTGTGQQSMNLGSDRGFEEFRAGYINRAQKKGLDIKGRTYAEIVEELCYHRV